jgi:hypothetical protein
MLERYGARLDALLPPINNPIMSDGTLANCIGNYTYALKRATHSETITSLYYITLFWTLPVVFLSLAKQAKMFSKSLFIWVRVKITIQW